MINIENKNISITDIAERAAKNVGKSEYDMMSENKAIILLLQDIVYRLENQND